MMFFVTKKFLISPLKWPEEPLLVVPDVNDNMPLTPFVPAFIVFTMTAPLESVDPSPVAIETAPPVFGKLCPAVIKNYFQKS